MKTRFYFPENLNCVVFNTYTCFIFPVINGHYECMINPNFKEKRKRKKKVFSYFLLLMSIVQLHLNSTHPLWKISKTSNAVGV